MNLQPAIDLIKQFEGLRLEAYLCSAGVPTIGIGTTEYPDGRKVKLGDTCTIAEANKWLETDIKFRRNMMGRALNADLNLSDNQNAALISLCYNIGITAFNRSTLVKKLNAKDFKGAADEFLKWNKAGGKVVKGLTKRREAERALFLA